MTKLLIEEALLRQALEAMECTVLAGERLTELDDASHALRAAIEQMERAEADKLENYRRLTAYRQNHVRYRKAMRAALKHVCGVRPDDVYKAESILREALGAAK